MLYWLSITRNYRAASISFPTDEHLVRRVGNQPGVRDGWNRQSVFTRRTDGGPALFRRLHDVIPNSVFAGPYPRHRLDRRQITIGHPADNRGRLHGSTAPAEVSVRRGVHS